MMRRMPSIVRSTTSSVSRILAFAPRARNARLQHAEIEADHHQRLPGFIVQLAADALALFFLRVHQMPGQLGNAHLSLAQCIGHAGAIDSQRGTVGDSAQQVALRGQPVMRLREADHQHAYDFFLRAQRHAPQRVRPVFQQMGVDPRRHGPQVRQDCGLAGLRDLAGKAFADLWSHPDSRSLPQILLANRSAALAARHRTSGSVPDSH